jgi:hypothetical protein
VVEQKFLQVFGTLVADFYAHRRPVAAGFELTLECSHEVADLFLVNIEITVTRHAELVTAIYIQTREQAIDMHPDN